MRQQLAELARNKDMLLLKKETSESMGANPQQRKKYLLEEQGKLQVTLAGVNKDKEDAGKQREVNRKKLADL